MTKCNAKYTLQSIPKSESWNFPLQGIEISQTDRDEKISFAKNLDDERLNDLLRPFGTLVIQDTLKQSVGRKQRLHSDPTGFKITRDYDERKTALSVLELRPNGHVMERSLRGWATLF